MLWIQLYDMQLTELTPTLQMHFQSLWELLVVMVVLWLSGPGSLLLYQSNCGSTLGFPSWANCCLLCCFLVSASFFSYCIPCLCLYWYIQPKLSGIMSESASLCKPYFVTLSNHRYLLGQILAGSLQPEAFTIAVPCLGVSGQIRNVLGCPSWCFSLCCTGFDKLVVG